MEFEFPPTLSAFMQDDSRHRWVLGPFGSGKSVACIMEVVRRAAMQKPGPDGKRKSRWAIVRNTMPQLRDTTLKSWMDIFPNGSIGYYKETGKTYFINQGDLQAEILFRALDDASDVKNLLSLELTGCWINEFKDAAREVVEALEGRIGRFPRMADGGPSWIGLWGDSNMPTEGTWWHRMLEGFDPTDGKTKKENGWKVYKQPPAMLSNIDGTYTPNLAADNLRNLPPGYYENLVLGKQDDFIRAYVMCEYARSLSGKPVHPAFNRGLHVSKTPLIPDKNSMLLLSADFGLTPAIVFLQQNAWGQIVVLDEIVTFGCGIERAIEEKVLPLMRQRFDGFDAQVTGDPSGATGSQSDETSCLQVFQRYRNKGLGKTKLAWSNTPTHRRGALDYFLTRLVDAGRPAFLIDPRCEWLIAALSGKYAFKSYRDGRESAEADKSDWSHCAEALEYGCMHYERGGRRKAELKERETTPYQPSVNPYATPR